MGKDLTDLAVGLKCDEGMVCKYKDKANDLFFHVQSKDGVTKLSKDQKALFIFGGDSATKPPHYVTILKKCGKDIILKAPVARRKEEVEEEACEEMQKGKRKCKKAKGKRK